MALERTLYFGEPDAATLNYWEIKKKCMKEGIKLIKPGVRCCDIALSSTKNLAEYGILDRRTLGMGTHLACCHTIMAVKRG